MTKERLVELCKGGGVIKVSISDGVFFLIAGGETNEITAKQADAVIAAMQDGRIPTVETAR